MKVFRAVAFWLAITVTGLAALGSLVLFINVARPLDSFRSSSVQTVPDEESKTTTEPPAAEPDTTPPQSGETEPSATGTVTDTAPVPPPADTVPLPPPVDAVPAPTPALPYPATPPASGDTTTQAEPPVVAAPAPGEDLIPYAALLVTSITAFSGVFFGWRNDRRAARDLDLRSKEMELRIRELELRLTSKP